MLGTVVNQINLIPPLWAYSLANIELLIMPWILRDKDLLSDLITEWRMVDILWVQGKWEAWKSHILPSVSKRQPTFICG